MKEKAIRKIFKYDLPLQDYAEVSMKIAAKILAVQIQGERLCIWALVDPDEDDETRTFRIASTGHPIKEADILTRYIGTVQLYAGTLVFHIFDITGQER